MKFNEVAIGQQFEFDGEQYLKTGPLVASTVEGSKQKFMARYAVVRLLGEATPAAKEKDERQLRVGLVMAAFDTFYARCVPVLQDLPQASRNEVEQARKEFLDSLN